MSAAAPLCPNCGNSMEMMEGPHGHFWAHCDYTQSSEAGYLFVPADRKTREARKEAHLALRSMWAREGLGVDQKKVLRGVFTDWLARYMDIDPRQCHVGLMNHSQCCQLLAAVAEGREMERQVGLRWDRWRNR